MDLTLNLSDILYKRIEKRSAVLGITPEMTATFLLAVNLREEEPEPAPALTFLSPFMQQPNPVPVQDDEAKEQKFVNKNQRMLAMEIASMLMGVGISTEKSIDEVWATYKEYFAKVNSKITMDNAMDNVPDKTQNP